MIRPWICTEGETRRRQFNKQWKVIFRTGEAVLSGPRWIIIWGKNKWLWAQLLLNKLTVYFLLLFFGGALPPCMFIKKPWAVCNELQIEHGREKLCPITFWSFLFLLSKCVVDVRVEQIQWIWKKHTGKNRSHQVFHTNTLDVKVMRYHGLSNKYSILMKGQSNNK